MCIPKIALFGPESTGKSTLALELAERFGTLASPEFAREYLQANDNRFDRNLDLQPIALGQVALENAFLAEAEKAGGPCLFCDTEVLTVANYSLFCFGEQPDWLVDLARRERCDFYLFLNLDVAWQADELRTHGHERERQAQIWKTSLTDFACRWAVISGTGAARTARAVAETEAFLRFFEAEKSR